MASFKYFENSHTNLSQVGSCLLEAFGLAFLSNKEYFAPEETSNLFVNCNSINFIGSRFLQKLLCGRASKLFTTLKIYCLSRTLLCINRKLNIKIHNKYKSLFSFIVCTFPCDLHPGSPKQFSLPCLPSPSYNVEVWWPAHADWSAGSHTFFLHFFSWGSNLDLSLSNWKFPQSAEHRFFMALWLTELANHFNRQNRSDRKRGRKTAQSPFRGEV